jgi:hypothetical protein
VFALGRDGKVLHKHRSDREWRPGATRWDPLPGRFEGALVARLLEDGTLLLVVLTPDRMLHTLAWRDYPDGRPDRDWEQARTLDALCESLLRETSPSTVCECEATHPRLLNGRNGHNGHNGNEGRVPQRGIRSSGR